MPNSEQPAKTVYFFGTCLADMIYPDTGMAAIRLLEREGLRVVFPRRQSCCGSRPTTRAFRPKPARWPGTSCASLPRSGPIVVPSGSCAGMMKHHYPTLFADDPDYALACRFAGRVYELGEYLNARTQGRFDRPRPADKSDLALLLPCPARDAGDRGRQGAHRSAR